MAMHLLSTEPVGNQDAHNGEEMKPAELLNRDFGRLMS
jgi:hypothetical protein